jgi:uncharacterized protein
MSTRRFHLPRRGILAIPLIAMACTVLPAQKDTTQFFILTSAPETASSGSSHPASHRELSIGLGPIDFPGYLKRREIVTRTSGDQIQLSQNKLWAESLDSNFQRVLGQDLARQLGTQRIVLFPWYGRPQLDYQVEVQVQRFDTDDTNRSQLNARWIIKDGKTGRELLANESNISGTVSATDAAGSEALSSDVNILSARIAQSLLGLTEGTGTAAELYNSSAAELSERQNIPDTPDY